MVSWTMKREIQMFTVAFMVNESHSKHLNFPLHGSWDQSPPCGAAFRSGFCIFTHLILHVWMSFCSKLQITFITWSNFPDLSCWGRVFGKWVREKWVWVMCQGNGSGEKMSPGNVSRKWVREKMSPGNGFRKWVQEKISFTDSSFTDAISQGNAQMCGPIGRGPHENPRSCWTFSNH